MHSEQQPANVRHVLERWGAPDLGLSTSRGGHVRGQEGSPGGGDRVEASLWPTYWCRDGKIEAAEEGPSVWRTSWKSWGSIIRTWGPTKGLEPGSAVGFMSFER